MIGTISTVSHHGVAALNRDMRQVSVVITGGMIRKMQSNIENCVFRAGLTPSHSPTSSFGARFVFMVQIEAVPFFRR